MRQLLIGDCHFGTSSNSVIWLENQLKFFNTQFTDILDNKNINRIVFMGDLFDIRYSINQQIGLEAKKLFRKFSNKYPNKEFWFIAGNHDYYSPLEEFHSYNIYDLVFGPEFVEMNKNFRFIADYPYEDKNTGNLYLPWYYTENFQNFSDLMYSLDLKNIKNIFCHTDLAVWDYSRLSLLKGINIFSGHIHNRFFKPEFNLYNLGSMFAFNFNDVNQKKYCYILEDDKLVEEIENTTTPSFKRYFNEEIFDLTENDFENAYVQLCIFNTNINKAKYIERIKDIKKNYADYNIKIQIIDSTLGETLEVTYFNSNIDKYIEDNIPEYLENKYVFIKDKIKNKEEN